MKYIKKINEEFNNEVVGSYSMSIIIGFITFKNNLSDNQDYEEDSSGEDEIDTGI